jgi:hypothetical protein
MFSIGKGIIQRAGGIAQADSATRKGAQLRWLAFLAAGTTAQDSRYGEVSEGQEALRTAGLETGATIFGDP